jgi:hypothetical protein
MTTKPDADDIDYEALADWAESDAPNPQNLQRVTPELRDELRAMLAAHITSAEDKEAFRRALGRPPLDANLEPGETSPRWQIRTTQNLDAAIRSAAATENRSFSVVLRQAALEYLQNHGYLEAS